MVQEFIVQQGHGNAMPSRSELHTAGQRALVRAVEHAGGFLAVAQVRLHALCKDISIAGIVLMYKGLFCNRADLCMYLVEVMALRGLFQASRASARAARHLSP